MAEEDRRKKEQCTDSEALKVEGDQVEAVEFQRGRQCRLEYDDFSQDADEGADKVGIPDVVLASWPEEDLKCPDNGCEKEVILKRVNFVEFDVAEL